MENKYKVGQEVFAIVNPHVILIVKRYVDRIYYCRVRSDTSDKALPFFERELKSASENYTI